MSHTITLRFRITQVNMRWEISRATVSKTLDFEFQCDSQLDLSTCKGKKIQRGNMYFREGESELFGELSYSPELEDVPAGLDVTFICTRELLESLLDRRTELIGVNVCIRLDENQKTIRYASNNPYDMDLVFDLASAPHVPVTSFSLSFTTD